MTKVYPNLASSCKGSRDEYDDPLIKKPAAGEQQQAVQLTVWKKSLLFNCNGFTVFDAKGNLVFRVDNYMAAASGEILLMDAAGNPLLTIRRKKKMSLADSWLVYEGETRENPMLCVRKKAMSMMNPRCLAQVFSSGGSLRYEIEGSFAQRCCVVYDHNNNEKRRRRSVVEILQKEAAVGGVTFGFDVFRMVVDTGLIETSLAMALVILLDQMYASPTRYLPT
ncbi:Protein LURP-one-related 8 [Linum grandiflorum]